MHRHSTSPLATLWAGVILTVALTACGGGGGGSSNSGGNTPTPTPTLAAPTNLKAAPGDTSATITFDKVASATSYSVNCKIGAYTATGTTSPTDSGSTVSVKVADMTNGMNYACTATSKADGYTSATSSTVSVTPVAGIYHLSVKATGLKSGTKLFVNRSLTQGGSTIETVTLNGTGSDVTATFLANFYTGNVYYISLAAQPLGQYCTVNDKAQGTVATSDISDFLITCTASVIIGDVTTDTLGTVQMPTLADYKVDPSAVNGKRYNYWAYLPDGTIDAITDITIKKDGAVSSTIGLGGSWTTVENFFDNNDATSGNQPCRIFPIQVGKTVYCDRPADFWTWSPPVNGVRTGVHHVGREVSSWRIESVVNVTVLGKPYKAFKFVLSDTITDNTGVDKFDVVQYYVPELYNWVHIWVTKTTESYGWIFARIENF